MTIIEAKDKLKVLRTKARSIREEISQLRSFLISKGIEPDRNVDHTKRNIKIFKDYKSGQKFTEIAKTFNLTPTTISGICKRVNYIIERKRDRYKKYL